MDSNRLSAGWQRIKIAWRSFNEFFQLAAAILQFVTAASVITAVIGFIQRNWSVFLTAGIFSLGIILGLVFAYRAFIASTSLRVDVYWKSAKYVYTISDDELDYEQIVEIEIQALRDGVESFVNKFWWTGTGEQDLRLLSIGHFLEMPPVPREAWRYYKVNFGRALNAGETETVIIQQTMKDTGRTHEPILSKVVTEPLGHLILEVHPPKTRPPSKVVLYEHATAFVLHPVSSKVVPFDRSKWCINWEIANPKFGHTYTIRWEY